MARDRRRPYTYSAACTDLKRALRRVSPGDLDYGLHGLRVQGYNDAKDGDDADMAGAHGGWQPGSHSRYARFQLQRVFVLSSRMVAQSAQAEEAGWESDESMGDEEDQAEPLAAASVAAAVAPAPAMPTVGVDVPVAPLAHFMSEGRVLRPRLTRPE